MNSQRENLYLIELLVQQVDYSIADLMDKRFLDSLGPTRVRFQCKGWPSVTVSEDEFGAQAPFSDKSVLIQGGKSSVFARSHDGLDDLSFNARLTVTRTRTRADGSVNEYIFGSAHVCIDKFADVLCSEKRCTKDYAMTTAPVISNLNQPVGYVVFFLRLTSLGSCVVSKYKGPMYCPSKDVRIDLKR